jgi:DNA (cytosine-5)-methyltransferase 1
VASLNAVSLFSNCGAGDVGFHRAGFRFRVVAEVDARRLEVACRNHPDAQGVPGDLVKTWKQVVRAYRRSLPGEPLDLLAACPPCQGMSSARGDRGLGNDPDAGSKDGRNLLVLPIASVAKALKPRVIVVENVPAFLTRQVRDPDTGEGVSAALLLINELDSQYEVFPLLADLAEFGVPQTRKRAFLTFVRRTEPRLGVLVAQGLAPYPIPSHSRDNAKRRPITLREALKRLGLPKLDAASVRAASYKRLPLHRVPVWADRRYAMVSAIRARSGASAWSNDTCEVCGEVDVGEKDVLCPECGRPLLRPVIKTRRGTYRLIRGFRTSSYRRMPPDKPAATVTTASGHLGSDLTIHPWENRVLSPLECADLQTIPRSFRWGDALEKWGHTTVRDMIGEAVPPHFTYRHGRVLRWLLTGRPRVRALRSDDPRPLRAADTLNLGLAKSKLEAAS